MKRSVFLTLICLFVLSSVRVSAEITTHPPDPNSDRLYVDGNTFYDRPVDDIEANFNAARAHEESELGNTLPDINLPNQAVWDGMSDNEKALLIINDERVARGVLPLTGFDSDVTAIAQTFATWLGNNDAWGHDQDWDGNGSVDSPWDRLNANPTINGCHDSLNISENLAVMVSSSAALPQDEAVAIAIYGWLYDDSLSLWGHRHALLWSSFNNNSGATSDEGLMGIGYWSGGPYQGPFSSQWPQVEMIVFNVFDPCSTWAFAAPTAVELRTTRTSAAPSLPALLIVFTGCVWITPRIVKQTSLFVRSAQSS